MKKLFSALLDILLKALRVKSAFQFLKKHKPFLITLLVALAIVFIEWFKSFDTAELMENKKLLLSWVEGRPLISSLSFFLVYFFISVLSFPGTAVLSIISGFLFGFFKGTLLSLLAVSIGSGTAFLLTRFFLKDFFIKKGGAKMQKIYKILEKDEMYYLFALRLFPFIPLFFTNIAMALSSMSWGAFFAVSFLSLLPSMAIYANMGTQLSYLEDWRGLSDPGLLTAFALIGLFPLFVRLGLRFFKKLKKSKEGLSIDMVAGKGFEPPTHGL